MNDYKHRLKFDLQMFAEGDDVASDPVASAEPASDQGQSQSYSDFKSAGNAFSDWLSASEEEPTPAEPVAVVPENNVVEPVVEKVDEIPPVFKVDTKPVEPVQQPAPIVKEPEPVKEPEKIPEMTAEQKEEFNAKFMEKFYEDPAAAIAEEVSRRVAEAVNQMTAEAQKVEAEQQKFTDIATNFVDTHADFDQYKDAMIEIIADPKYGLVGKEHALETAYAIAKGKSVDKVPTIDDMLSDEKVIQKILENKDITGKAIANYLKTLSENGTPVVIGQSKGGDTKPPVAEETPKPRTFKEANEAFMKATR